MRAERTQDRKVLEIGGADRLEFLQGLITNDVGKTSGGLVYAAILSPQGKYLADFFLLGRRDSVLLDIKAGLAPDLLNRLSMYRLRSAVTLNESDIPVWRGIGKGPEGSFPDPRDASLGWRYYGELDAEAAEFGWDALRVAACVPETGIELVPNETYILEAGFERLSGVDFKKGCYVGQEVTARMKHKSELRKGLALVEVDGAAPVGADIIANGKPAGRLFTQFEGRGIAWLRFDRAVDGMKAGNASLRRAPS